MITLIIALTDPAFAYVIDSPITRCRALAKLPEPSGPEVTEAGVPRGERGRVGQREGRAEPVPAALCMEGRRERVSHTILSHGVKHYFM